MKQLAESKEENKLLKEKLLKLETYGRHENLVFCGVEEQISGYETVKELYKKGYKYFCEQTWNYGWGQNGLSKMP